MNYRLEYMNHRVKIESKYRCNYFNVLTTCCALATLIWQFISQMVTSKFKWICKYVDISVFSPMQVYNFSSFCNFSGGHGGCECIQKSEHNQINSLGCGGGVKQIIIFVLFSCFYSANSMYY